VTSGSSVRPTHNTLHALNMPATADMQRPHPIRAIMASALILVTLGALLAPPLLHAQFGNKQRGSTLPPTAPTPPPPAPPVQPVQPAQSNLTSTPTPAPTTPARRADVTYADGMLSISANNSSLNQILREISRETGMKITGGVTDERVFGTYGPAAPGKILATLLDGTGSNMILVQNNSAGSNAAPMELVLTPRHGGPTPPNPNAPGFNDGAELDDRRAPQTVTDRPLPPPSVPVADPNSAVSTPAPAVTQTPLPIQGLPATPADATTPTTQDQSPNGVKTPQQIYDQLLKLRQQSQQPPPNL
jgi:hypothetical protein